jgi:branched-subunit amino acid transport protein
MRLETLWLLLGMAIVTFLPRFLPMAFLTRRAIPEKMKIGLDYIPVAILSAIVFPLLFSPSNGKVEPQLILAALPVFIFAHRMKNLWGSVILGMLVYWGLGLVF